MGFLQAATETLKSLWGGPQRRYSLSDMDAAMDAAFNGNLSATGLAVNQSKSLQVVAVYACVNVLAQTIASLPLILYERLNGRGKDRAQSHYLYPLLHDAPNPEMTAMEFRECQIGHLCLWGNSYSEIQRREIDQKVMALWPLRPDKMEIDRDSQQQLIYKYRLASGEQVIFQRNQIHHVRGLSSNGIVGYSPIKLAMEAIGLTMATEQYGARFFGNDARPGGALQSPGKLSDPAYDRMIKSWEEAHRGLNQAHRIAIFEEGATWKEIGIPPEHAQFLETRKFQKNEIATLFRIPPHMIGDLERATFSNIEMQSLEFVIYTLRPWLVRLEQAITRDLLMPFERSTYYSEFLVDGLLRGDIAARYSAYSTGIQYGFLSPNDIRAFENMNPVDGGDNYYIPLNLMEIGSPPPSAEATRQMLIFQLGQNNSKALEGLDIKELPESIEDRDGLTVQEVRSLAGRKKLRDSYKNLFVDATDRVVKREKADVMRAAKKFLSSRSDTDFALWLRDFFKTHPEYVKKTFMPAFKTYAELVNAQAADEIKAEADIDAEIELFIDGYADNMVAEFVYKSDIGIRKAWQDAIAANANPVESLSAYFDELTEKRPDKVAGLQVVELAGAIAVLTWKKKGIRRLAWVAFGKNCPYCSNLNGKIVGIEEFFLQKDNDFKPEGAEAPLRPSRNIKHPPGHLGCDCSVLPK